jgi:DNA-binding transcriptional LysR family regulator
MQKNANFALIDAKNGSQMNTQQLRYFLALADELHFWRTSEKVFITQSALSRHIKSLEQELGVRLFERDKRNVKLTDAGGFLKTELARILTDLESVSRHAKQIAAGEVGMIRIGHPASITFSVLPEILLGLTQKHPNVIAQMIEVDAVDVADALLTHKIDLAFNREVDESKELESKMLMTENFALVVSSDHRINRAENIDLSDLKDEWFVLPSLNGKSEHVAQLKTIFSEAGFEPRVRFESDFGATLLGLVAKGLGISIMPYSYSHYLTEEVRFIKIPATSSLYAIWRAKDGNPVLENFLSVIDTIADRG